MIVVAANAAAKPAAAIHRPTGIFRSSGRHTVLLGLALVAFTLALYNPAARNGFVSFDDDRYVTGNPHVRAGLHWSTISWAFRSLEQANWHPLTWLSHALDCQIFRLNPAGHHYTNVLLHAANTLLLFLILQWFTGYTGRSLMVAALFAAHPLNVESVAWVAERKSVLSMLFFLLALAAYGWYARRPGAGRYMTVVLFFAMGLMSKPMVITLPMVLLLLDYWPLRRMALPSVIDPGADREGPTRAFALKVESVPKLCLEKLPFLALSAGSAIITLIAQKSGGAVLTSAAGAPWLRLENALVSYALYIEKAIWPTRLVALYPYPHSLPSWQVIASAIFLIAVSCAVLKYHKRRYLLVGWLWYLGTMAPMIGLVQVGNQAMADRYAYLPMIGLFVMSVWAMADGIGTRHGNLLATSGATLVILLAVVTRVQIGYWHDDFSLWSHALAVTRNNYVAENNYAHALVKQGRENEAIAHFRAASAIEPGDPVSQLNLGIYAQEHGDLRQAAARYQSVLELATDAQLRGSAYANLGTVYFAQRDYAEAQRDFDSAMQMKQVFPIALLDMGLIAARTAQQPDDWHRAAGYFAQFAAAAPDDVGYVLLAHALNRGGREEDAKAAYQKALQLSANIGQTEQRAAQLEAP